MQISGLLNRPGSLPTAEKSSETISGVSAFSDDQLKMATPTSKKRKVNGIFSIILYKTLVLLMQKCIPGMYDAKNE